jgi:hypothetical protein
VKIFSGADVADPAIATANLTSMADFEAIEDPMVGLGCHTAVGDINGDGVPDLLAGAAEAPRVAGWDGTTLRSGQTPAKLFNDFYAFNPAQMAAGPAVHVAVADLNGDGYGEVLASYRSGEPRAIARIGIHLVQGIHPDHTILWNKKLGDTASTGGLRIAARKLNADNRTDLVLSHGTGSKVTTITNISTTGFAFLPGSADLISGWTGGVWVG